MTPDRSIRFGILCNGVELQLWQVDALNQLLADPRFELCLVVTDSSSYQSKSIFQKLGSHFLYNQYETRFLKPGSRVRENAGKLFTGAKSISCSTLPVGKYSQKFTDKDIEIIKAENLDFIIRFGFNILKGEILNATKWGIWSYHHGDPVEFRGGPPGFWEILKRQKITGAILQRLTPTLDQGIILHEGKFPSVLHSYPEQIDRLLFGSASWIKTAALDCFYGNIDPEKGIRTITDKGKINKRPSNILFIGFLIRLFLNRLKFYHCKYFYRDKWQIGVSKTSVSEVLNNRYLDQPIWLEGQSTREEYLADPFAIQTEQGLQLVFEDYSYKTKKAFISEATFDKESKQFSTKRQLLSEKHHLSYPFVFSYKSEPYILPEAWNSNGLSLYKLQNGELGKAISLLTNTAAIDPTLVEHDEKFWLFVTDRSAPSFQLYIYFADNIEGPYIAHQGNPVKTDVSNSRPGGSFFKYENELYRPVQNCTETYGGSLKINRIIELSATSFKEETVNEIFPDPSWKFNRGLHTLSIVGENVIFDAKLEEFNFNPKGN